MNNETIVCNDYSRAITTVLSVYGVAILVAVILAVKAVVANV